MGKYNKLREEAKSDMPIWSKRINELLALKNLTQFELAPRSGVSAPTISDWVGAKRKGELREPKITGFKGVAKCLGVSTDYLLGENECKTLENEEIYKTTGLSDGAIEALKSIQKSVIKGKSSAERKLAVCNYLIKNMNKSSFFESLYDYLFGVFFFRSSNGKNLNGATFVISRSPSGKERKSVGFSSVFSQASYALVQRDLIRIKDEIDKQNEVIEKKEYEEWEKENGVNEFSDILDKLETEANKE